MEDVGILVGPNRELLARRLIECKDNGKHTRLVGGEGSTSQLFCIKRAEDCKSQLSMKFASNRSLEAAKVSVDRL